MSLERILDEPGLGRNVEARPHCTDGLSWAAIAEGEPVGDAPPGHCRLRSAMASFSSAGTGRCL